MPVGEDAFVPFAWRLEDGIRKGEIISAASLTGNTLCPCEEKPDEIGDMSDVGRLVVEWTGEVR